MSARPQPLIIFGAGGHAREIANIVADINCQAGPTWELLGFVADYPPARPDSLPGPWLGSPEAIRQWPAAWLFIAVGDPGGRRAVVDRLLGEYPAARFATLVHPSVWLGAGVRIGAGSVIFPGCQISVDVELGRHVTLNLACTVSHDGCLGDYASLGPGVHLAGAVTVGEGADLGAGVIARPMSRIGARATVGAGGVVVHAIPDDTVAVGIPARARQLKDVQT